MQVKSEANQQTLAKYVATFEADPAFQRMFFACHSPKGKIVADAKKPVHVWTGQVTARRAIAAGLLEWLIEKTS